MEERSILGWETLRSGYTITQLFLFREGAVVMWGVESEAEERAILTEVEAFCRGATYLTALKRYCEDMAWRRWDRTTFPADPGCARGVRARRSYRGRCPCWC